MVTKIVKYVNPINVFVKIEGHYRCDQDIFTASEGGWPKSQHITFLDVCLRKDEKKYYHISAAIRLQIGKLTVKISCTISTLALSDDFISGTTIKCLKNTGQHNW